MSEWKEFKLGAIANFKYGTMPKKNKLTDKGFPVYSGYKYTGFYPECNCKKGDLIVVARGVGGTGNVKICKDDCYLTNLSIRIELDREIASLSFFYYKYLLRTLRYLDSGSAQSQLTINDLREINILLPALSEQKAIAAILSSLDDKIDLLHRQNKTLEAMAETLFRQWFVEEVGEDWEDGTLGDLVELHYGKALKKSSRTGNGYPVIGSSGIVDYHSNYLVGGPGIVIGRKGTLGKTIYLTDNFYPIDTTYFVKPKNPDMGFLFLYFLLRSIDFKEMNSDSAVPGLNRDIALSVEIRIPSTNKICNFNELVATQFKKINKNKIQIETLSKLRDTLLPKLMSGEVRVKL